MLAGVAAALGAALVGTVVAVRRVVNLPPAEAMRPDAPATYRVSLIERAGLRNWLSQPARMAVRNLQRRPGRALLSTLAISVSVALLIIGLFSLDSVGLVLTRQFYESQRYDAMVSFVRPVSASAFYDVTRLPAVRHAEPFRAVPIRLRAGPRERYLSILGADPGSRLNRILDDDGRVIEIPTEGLVLSRKLGELLGLAEGDRVELDVLEGDRPTIGVTVSRLVDDFMGLNAYMNVAALHRLMGEAPLLSGAYLMIDTNGLDALYTALQATPAVAGVAVKHETIRSFQEVLEQNLGTSRTVNVIFAAIIAFGVVYNIARVALSERGRELATLRVIGFTRPEIARVLFGEWAFITGLALPFGCLVGYGLAAMMVQAFSTEVFRLPLIIKTQTYLTAVGTVLLATVASALVVRRRLDHLDLIAVLKTRE